VELYIHSSNTFSRRDAQLKKNGTTLPLPYMIYDIRCDVMLYMIYIYDVICDKGKGKVVPVLNQAPCHEEVMGDGDVAPLILLPLH